MRHIASFFVILVLIAVISNHKVNAFYKPSGVINVYSISIIQPDPKNTNYMDPNAAPFFSGKTLDYVKNYIKISETDLLNTLPVTTAFRKYLNSNSPIYLNYNYLGSKTYVEQVKPGLKVPWSTTAYRPDYTYYLNRENICDLVDNKNVKEIWFWTHHNNDIEPVESDMSMGKQIQEYWNYTNYGDASNSERSNDLPICNSTYTLFNFNITTSLESTLEDYGHHYEAIFSFLNTTLFWQQFAGTGNSGYVPVNPGCGDTHVPPNGTIDYDYMNTRLVDSDCMDWKPDRTGIKTKINCYTWSKSNSCANDDGVTYLIWWMQSFPGLDNNLVDTNGKNLRNWWEVKENFDKVVQQETKLYKWKYGDFNKDSADNILDSTFFLKSLFNNTTKIFFDLDDSNSVNLNDLVLQLNSL